MRMRFGERWGDGVILLESRIRRLMRKMERTYRLEVIAGDMMSTLTRAGQSSGTTLHMDRDLTKDLYTLLLRSLIREGWESQWQTNVLCYIHHETHGSKHVILWQVSIQAERRLNPAQAAAALYASNHTLGTRREYNTVQTHDVLVAKWSLVGVSEINSAQLLPLIPVIFSACTHTRNTWKP